MGQAKSRETTTFWQQWVRQNLEKRQHFGNCCRMTLWYEKFRHCSKRKTYSYVYQGKNTVLWQKHNVIIGTRHFLQEKQRRFDSKNDDSKRRKKRRYCDQKQTTIRQNCGNRTMILLAYKNYNSLPIKKTSKHEETQQNLCQKAKCRGRRPWKQIGLLVFDNLINCSMELQVICELWQTFITLVFDD